MFLLFLGAYQMKIRAASVSRRIRETHLILFDVVIRRLWPNSRTCTSLSWSVPRGSHQIFASILKSKHFGMVCEVSSYTVRILYHILVTNLYLMLPGTEPWSKNLEPPPPSPRPNTSQSHKFIHKWLGNYMMYLHLVPLIAYQWTLQCKEQNQMISPLNHKIQCLGMEGGGREWHYTLPLSWKEQQQQSQSTFETF